MDMGPWLTVDGDGPASTHMPPTPEAQTLRAAGWGSVSSLQGHSWENKFKYFHYSHIYTI